MGGLIHDVNPKQEPVITMTTGKIVALLYKRGVTIEDIFGIYYAIDAGSATPVLTVGDAQLVHGHNKPPKMCEHKRVNYCSVKECKLNW